MNGQTNAFHRCAKLIYSSVNIDMFHSFLGTFVASMICDFGGLLVELSPSVR